MHNSFIFRHFSKIFTVMFCVAFLSILAYWGFIAYVGVQVVQGAQSSGGIKPMIEKAWCGAPGCLDGNLEKKSN